MDYSLMTIDVLLLCFEQWGYEYYCDGDEKKYHTVNDVF